ncbi:glycerol-3-phosphate acyltransferase, partial [bacterium]|nr:glycerol-3-phosphate acyltransferase [bacterium]
MCSSGGARWSVHWRWRGAGRSDGARRDPRRGGRCGFPRRVDEKPAPPILDAYWGQESRSAQRADPTNGQAVGTPRCGVRSAFPWSVHGSACHGAHWSAPRGTDTLPTVVALIYLAAAVGSYLVGSIPTGYLWGKARGIDIRTIGSGNIGATNVMRALGKGPGITVLLLDTLKGFLPVCLAPWLLPDVDRVSLQVVCCLAVIAGHNWTCWLKFKGGKGIATSAGAFLAVLPGVLLVA